jgi:hypothetical protein
LIQIRTKIKLTADVEAISSTTGSSAVDVGSQLLDLLDVLVSDDVSSGGSGIGSQHDSVLEIG